METTGIILGLYRVILGLSWDIGKENGNYYNRLVLGLSSRWTPPPSNSDYN